jgi:hypothetical protein
MGRSRDEYHAVGRYAFVLPGLENKLWFSILIDQQPTKPVADWPSLSKAHLGKPRFAGEDLHGELAAIFWCHRSLECL